MADSITSYATLIQAVKDVAEDDSAEFNSYLPVAIDNAERKLSKELDTLDLIYTSTVTVAASTAFITKPSGHLVTKYITVIDPTTGRKAVIRKKSDSYLDEYWPQETSAGTPKYYSDEDKTTFKIAPCASATTSVKISGIRRPTALTSANPTNIFTSAVPHALFYATMIEAATWQRNTDLLNMFSAHYTAARDAINNEGRRQRRDDTTESNVYPAENTLTGGA